MTTFYIIIGVAAVGGLVATIWLKQGKSESDEFGLGPPASFDRTPPPSAEPEPAAAPEPSMAAGPPAEASDTGFEIIARLDDLRPGDTVSIETSQYAMQQKDRYTANGEEWFEVKLIDDAGEEYWLGWDSDMKVSLSQKMPFEELDIDTEELDQVESIQFGDETYRLAASGQGQYHENCQSQGEPYDYWDFEDDSGAMFVSVECWDGEEYEATNGAYVNPDDVEMFRSN